ncbi:hypothetical protein [Burkholderia pseudomallei]|nr:hypothetical protein [Burkholderia pseudomallei]
MASRSFMQVITRQTRATIRAHARDRPGIDPRPPLSADIKLRIERTGCVKRLIERFASLQCDESRMRGRRLHKHRWSPLRPHNQRTGWNVDSQRDNMSQLVRPPDVDDRVSGSNRRAGRIHSQLGAEQPVFANLLPLPWAQRSHAGSKTGNVERPLQARNVREVAKALIIFIFADEHGQFATEAIEVAAS